MIPQISSYSWLSKRKMYSGLLLELCFIVSGSLLLDSYGDCNRKNVEFDHEQSYFCLALEKTFFTYRFKLFYRSQVGRAMIDGLHVEKRSELIKLFVVCLIFNIDEPKVRLVVED